MDEPAPYLTVVAEATEGANSFGALWKEQAERHGLDLELIVTAPARRNAGIRKARGEFILATRIANLCPEELVCFLASNSLQKGRFYRADRLDGEKRLIAREGVFTLTAGGLRENPAGDITSPGSGIHFGNGWFPLTEINDRVGRFAGNDAEVILTKLPRPWAALDLEIEPGPAVRPPTPLQVIDNDGAVVAAWEIAGRRTIRLWIPPAPDGGIQRLRLRAPEGGWPKLSDLHIWNMRCFRADWADLPAVSTLPWKETVTANRPTLSRLRSRLRILRAMTLLRGAAHDVFGAGVEGWDDGWSYLEHSGGESFRWVASEAHLVVRRTGRAKLAMLLEAGPGIEGGSFTLLAGSQRVAVAGLQYVELSLPEATEPVVQIAMAVEGGAKQTGDDDRVLAYRVFACAVVGGAGAGESPAKTISCPWPDLTLNRGRASIDWVEQLRDSESLIAEMGRREETHLNAAGDFLLMAREHWHELRGFPEIDAAAADRDALLCIAARESGLHEEILPMPILRTTSDSTAEAFRVSGDMLWVANQMRRRHVPAIFNSHHWGRG